MSKVKTVRVFNLVDSKGNKLLLELGITDVMREDKPWSSADQGWRWRFIGRNIPMPVRSMYWFNGFPEPIMIDWLKGNGWYVHTRVNMFNGYTEVYELPKGNESLVDIDNGLSKTINELGKEAFHYALKKLWTEGTCLKAVRVYRYVHGGTIGEATRAVREIVDGKP